MRRSRYPIGLRDRDEAMVGSPSPEKDAASPLHVPLEAIVERIEQNGKLGAEPRRRLNVPLGKCAPLSSGHSHESPKRYRGLLRGDLS